MSAWIQVLDFRKSLAYSNCQNDCFFFVVVVFVLFCFLLLFFFFLFFFVFFVYVPCIRFVTYMFVYHFGRI